MPSPRSATPPTAMAAGLRVQDRGAPARRAVAGRGGVAHRGEQLRQSPLLEVRRPLRRRVRHLDGVVVRDGLELDLRRVRCRPAETSVNERRVLVLVEVVEHHMQRCRRVERQRASQAKLIVGEGRQPRRIDIAPRQPPPSGKSNGSAASAPPGCSTPRSHQPCDSRSANAGTPQVSDGCDGQWPAPSPSNDQP